MTIERITGCDPQHFGFDELVASNALVHIERMNRGHMWMQVTCGPHTVTLNFHAKKNTLEVNVTNDGPSSPQQSPEPK